MKKFICIFLFFDILFCLGCSKYNDVFIKNDEIVIKVIVNSNKNMITARYMQNNIPNIVMSSDNNNFIFTENGLKYLIVEPPQEDLKLYYKLKVTDTIFSPIELKSRFEYLCNNQKDSIINYKKIFKKDIIENDTVVLFIDMPIYKINLVNKDSIEIPFIFDLSERMAIDLFYQKHIRFKIEYKQGFPNSILQINDSKGNKRNAGDIININDTIVIVIGK